jgi:hypothetical protein
MGLRKLLEKQCVGEKAVPRLYISLGPRFFANSLKKSSLELVKPTKSITDLTGTIAYN